MTKDIEFKATADYNAVVTELDKVRRQNERLIAQQGEMKRGADDNERAQVRAMRELERFAQQTGRSVQTVNERHREQLEKLKAAYEANLLTAEEYGRAVEKANEDAANSYDVVAEKVDRVDDKQQSATSSTEGLGAAVGKAVAGYLSFNMVLSKVSQALQWTREQTEAAMASFEGMADPWSRLAQIADPEVEGKSLNELTSRVDDLAKRYGRDRGEVAQVMFSAWSLGFQDSVEDLVKYHDIVKMGEAQKVAGQVPRLFRNAHLTPEESVAMTLVASRQSPLSFEQIAAAMPTIAEGAAMAGATPEESMATLAIMADQFTTAEQAAQRFKALATRFAISGDERLQGKGILGGAEALMQMDEEEQREFLGRSQELNVAFSTLKARIEEVRGYQKQLEDERATVQAGGVTTLERRRLEWMDPETRAGQMRLAAQRDQQARVADEIERENAMALAGLETRATRTERLREMRGEATFGQFAVQGIGTTAEFAGAGERGTGAVMELARRFYGGTETNLEFMGRAVTDVAGGGMPGVERIVTPREMPSSPWWMPGTNPLAMFAGAMQTGVQWVGGGRPADEQLLREQQRANEEAVTQTQLLREIAGAGPRSGTSTLSQPQMAAQTIPR